MSRRQWINGWCLLCRRPDLMVLFIGPVETCGMCAPVHVCEGCLEFVRTYIQQYNAAWDARPAS